MVLDLKKVKLKHSLDAGTLYVVEQIPSYVEYSEQTDVLRKGIFFVLGVGRMMRVCVCVCVHMVGNMWCVSVWWRSVCWGRKDGNATASYTGEEFPGSAQCIKPAPRTLKWPCVDWDGPGIHHLMTVMVLMLPPLLGFRVKLLVQFSEYWWERHAGPGTRTVQMQVQNPWPLGTHNLVGKQGTESSHFS